METRISQQSLWVHPENKRGGRENDRLKAWWADWSFQQLGGRWSAEVFSISRWDQNILICAYNYLQSLGLRFSWDFWDWKRTCACTKKCVAGLRGQQSMTWHVNKLHQDSHQGVAVSLSPLWLSRWDLNIYKKIKTNLHCFHPPMGLPECFSADITSQRPGKPISLLLYHSLLPASCPDDVTHHMVFSSIKPEKWFSQWRGEGEKRRRAGTGRRLVTKNKRLALPLVCTLSGRYEGKEG